MADATERTGKVERRTGWLSWLPPSRWLADYSAAWLPFDIMAGITLAAYAIPVSLAYAGLAGLPPQVGIYGYLLGEIGYALLGSSRQLAIGPTSAISLMIAGTVGAMAAGDTLRYAQIASLAAFTVAVLSFFAWLLRLSALVKLISDSILVGFKTGAGLTIAMTQLPSLFGVAGGGHNFFERAYLFVGQLGQTQVLILLVGLVALVLLVAGERLLPGRPIALGVVVLAIAAATVFGLPALGVPVTGKIPSGLPSLAPPALRIRDVEGIIPLAGGCLLLAYSRACPRLEPLRRSTATRSMHARSFSVSAPPISQRRLDRVIRLLVDCRSRPSTTRPARAPRWRSSSPRSRWPCACFFSRGCWRSFRRPFSPQSSSPRCMDYWISRRCSACGRSAG